MDTQRHTDAWEFDVSLAISVAVLWWCAEYVSQASQTYLWMMSDLNYAWSAMSVLLATLAVGATIAEQFLRERYKLSIPSTISTLVNASLPYLLLRERYGLFDRRARLLQQLLRADKLRFGRSGSLNRSKYIVEWRFFKRAKHWASWAETASRRHPNEQVLVDWSTSHRLGGLEKDDVVTSIRARGRKYQELLGFLLFAWLPTGSFENLKFDGRWLQRGKLKGGYHGSAGRALGLKADSLKFEQWMRQGASREHFALVAVEYPEATRLLIDSLSEVVSRAQSSDGAARLLLAKWDLLIEDVKNRRP